MHDGPSGTTGQCGSRVEQVDSLLRWQSAENRTLNGAPADTCGRNRTRIADFGAPTRRLIGVERDVLGAPAMESRAREKE